MLCPSIIEGWMHFVSLNSWTTGNQGQLAKIGSHIIMAGLSLVNKNRIQL